MTCCTSRMCQKIEKIERICCVYGRTYNDVILDVDFGSSYAFTRCSKFLRLVGDIGNK